MEILTLDLHFQNVPHSVAAYHAIGPDGPVLIETGPASTLPRLLHCLRENGYDPVDVRDVLVTHIHLDHSGAAGWWTHQGARVFVHPVGAPHLIEPSRLLKSAGRIYGDRLQSLWGDTQPARSEKVTTVEHGEVVEAGGLRFEVIETLGHARHHHAFRIGDVAFTGDAAGIRLPGYPLIDLPAPPPEFDPEAWADSVDRLEQANLKAIYPTHFGRLDDVGDYWQNLRELIVSSAEFVRARQSAGDDRDSILEDYKRWNRERALAASVPEEAIRQYWTANPLDMSVDGIMRYWHKKSVISRQ